MSELLDFLISHGDQFRRARLPSLYSDFSFQRYSNPDGFAANTTAWIDALTKAARAGLLLSDGADRDTLLLKTGENLMLSLETKEWGRPLALKTVIDEAVSQRKLIPYDEFFTARRSIYNRTWTIQPWHLFPWGLKQLGLLGWSTGAGQLPAASFVIIRSVEEAANKIVKEMGTLSNQIDQISRIYPMSMFSTEASKILNLHDGLTDNDLRLILTYLARDKSRVVYDSKTVKFKDTGEMSTLSNQDKTVASLKALIADINIQIEILSMRISTLSENAQKAINNKSRASALAALRSKKLSEATLSQRSETLAQLEEVYSKIEQAADQVAVVCAMEASTGVLRNLHAQVGGIDKVEDVIEGLRNEMGKVDDIGGIIEASAQLDSVVDESAVDEELESLERQANARQEEEEAYQTQERLASITAVQETKELQQKHQIDPQELSFDSREPESQIKEGVSS